MSAISSGGSCRSQSMTTTASPAAASMPASVAAGRAKRRGKRSNFTPGARPRIPRAVLGGVVDHVDIWRAELRLHQVAREPLRAVGADQPVNLQLRRAAVD